MLFGYKSTFHIHGFYMAIINPDLSIDMWAMKKPGYLQYIGDYTITQLNRDQ